MRLVELREFILRTRQTEGVNWFLSDVTPHLNFKSQLYTLFCYDDFGHLTKVVDMIEERVRNEIPRYKMREIAEARNQCGVNSWYLRRKPNRTDEEKLDLFDHYAEEWVETGSDIFIQS